MSIIAECCRSKEHLSIWWPADQVCVPKLSEALYGSKIIIHRKENVAVGLSELK